MSWREKKNRIIDIDSTREIITDTFKEIITVWLLINAMFVDVNRLTKKIKLTRNILWHGDKINLSYLILLKFF